jgi:hypothetical protein
MTQDRREGPFEQLGEAVGGGLGKAAGRAHDMAANAVGSVVGSAMQALGSWWATPDAQRASSSFGDAEDRACREHFTSRSRGSTGSTGSTSSTGSAGSTGSTSSTGSAGSTGSTTSMGSGGTTGSTSSAGGAGDYDRAREAYRFGHVASQNPEYASRPFDQVEAQVERAWEKVGRESHGDWSEVRDQVSFGYTYRTPGAPNPS